MTLVTKSKYLCDECRREQAVLGYESEGPRGWWRVIEMGDHAVGLSLPPVKLAIDGHFCSLKCLIKAMGDLLDEEGRQVRAERERAR